MSKSEKEKMLLGEYYDAGDEELVKERAYARFLINEINHNSPQNKEQVKELFNKLFNENSNKDFNIEPPFYCDYGYNIELGKNFYANFNCTILDVNKVKIGNNVMFGPNVQIYTASHPLDPEERLEGFEYAREINIGDNVWIGGGSIILPGVSIGDNSVIGAGSVVSKDIANNVLAVGNPCRVIRKIWVLIYED